MRPIQIISGGQSGADTGGIEAALFHSIPVGGWAPMGWEAEDGCVPMEYRHPMAVGGGLRECPEPGYAARTKRNVALCDGVVVFTFEILGVGSGLTMNMARQMGKPCLRIDLSKIDLAVAACSVHEFVRSEAVQRLMIAGTRESRARGISSRVRSVVVTAFSA